MKSSLIHWLINTHAKAAVHRSLVTYSPRLLIQYYRLERRGERELRLVKYLCQPDKVSVDVGASEGLYTLWALPYSKKVYAFEPRREAHSLLVDIFSGQRGRVQVERIALSDKSGSSELRCPSDDPRLSTIDMHNHLGGNKAVTNVEVMTKRLDEVVSEEVGFIKIDVEGHEKSVIEGARGLLEQDRPNLIVEAEERHHPGSVRWLFESMNNLHYASFFFDQGCLRMGDKFDLSVHQRPDNISGPKKLGTYVNNFIFVADKNLADRLVKNINGSDG
jgi:FkbM family methyltransferase